MKNIFDEEQVAAAGPPPLEHTPAERKAMLGGMEGASNIFYLMAQKIGFHEFLEITGFMNELIKICRGAHDSGVNFVSGLPPVKSYEAAYIGEKFGCIFRDAFAGNEEAVAAFCRTAFGVRVKVERP